MELITKAPKGTVDLVPQTARRWRWVEQALINEAELNGFAEVRTPVFEHTELFQRGMGDVTDVVEKQMYTFEDKGGRSVTLRPEGTAGAVRAMLENGLYNNGYPVRLYYNIPCYRYEKPQKGRMREFRTFGVEVFGTAEPIADAQLIAMGMSALQRLGLTDVGLQLNSIGCPTCRKEYHQALQAYFSARKESLCPTCLSRLDRNPMRILDCKSPQCQEIAAGAPKITQYLCQDCTSLGFALGGGGRYDGLVEEIGGPPTPALGFGLGMDRLMLALEAQKTEFPEEAGCEVFVAAMGEAAKVKAMSLVNTLHKCGLGADCDVCGRGLKAQMKYAGKLGAQYCLVLGDDELAAGKARLKYMAVSTEKGRLSL